MMKDMKKATKKKAKGKKKGFPPKGAATQRASERFNKTTFSDLPYAQ